jgi:hypothetical protein
VKAVATMSTTCADLVDKLEHIEQGVDVLTTEAANNGRQLVGFDEGGLRPITKQTRERISRYASKELIKEMYEALNHYDIVACPTCSELSGEEDIISFKTQRNHKHTSNYAEAKERTITVNKRTGAFGCGCEKWTCCGLLCRHFFLVYLYGQAHGNVRIPFHILMLDQRWITDRSVLTASTLDALYAPKIADGSQYKVPFKNPYDTSMAIGQLELSGFPSPPPDHSPVPARISGSRMTEAQTHVARAVTGRSGIRQQTERELHLLHHPRVSMALSVAIATKTPAEVDKLVDDFLEACGHVPIGDDIPARTDSMKPVDTKGSGGRGHKRRRTRKKRKSNGSDNDADASDDSDLNAFIEELAPNLRKPKTQVQRPATTTPTITRTISLYRGQKRPKKQSPMVGSLANKARKLIKEGGQKRPVCMDLTATDDSTDDGENGKSTEYDDGSDYSYHYCYGYGGYTLQDVYEKPIQCKSCQLPIFFKWDRNECGGQFGLTTNTHAVHQRCLVCEDPHIKVRGRPFGSCVACTPGVVGMTNDEYQVLKDELKTNQMTFFDTCKKKYEQLTMRTDTIGSAPGPSSSSVNYSGSGIPETGISKKQHSKTNASATTITTPARGKSTVSAKRKGAADDNLSGSQPTPKRNKRRRSALTSSRDLPSREAGVPGTSVAAEAQGALVNKSLEIRRASPSTPLALSSSSMMVAPADDNSEDDYILAPSTVTEDLRPPTDGHRFIDEECDVVSYLSQYHKTFKRSNPSAWNVLAYNVTRSTPYSYDSKAGKVLSSSMLRLGIALRPPTRAHRLKNKPLVFMKCRRLQGNETVYIELDWLREHLMLFKLTEDLTAQEDIGVPDGHASRKEGHPIIFGGYDLNVDDDGNSIASSDDNDARDNYATGFCDFDDFDTNDAYSPRFKDVNASQCSWIIKANRLRNGKLSLRYFRDKKTDICYEARDLVYKKDEVLGTCIYCRAAPIKLLDDKWVRAPGTLYFKAWKILPNIQQVTPKKTISKKLFNASLDRYEWLSDADLQGRKPT